MLNYFLAVGTLYLLTLVFHADCISWRRIFACGFFVLLIQLLFFIVNTQLLQSQYVYSFLIFSASLDKQAIAAVFTILALCCQFILLKLCIRLPIRSTLITVLLMFVVSQIPSWIASRNLLRFMTITGSEMVPTLNPGDCVLLRLTLDKSYSPQRNDIVTFAADEGDKSGSQWQTSRLVGLPGDSMSIANGLILINEQIVGVSSSAIQTSRGRRYTIPEGLCFCLGDNSALAIDSRQLGLLPLDKIKGHIELIIFPAFPKLLKPGLLLQKPAIPKVAP